jgi:hypothetical protein
MCGDRCIVLVVEVMMVMVMVPVVMVRLDVVGGADGLGSGRGLW